MPDLLVDLLKLPPPVPGVDESTHPQILVRRAQPFELTPARRFVEQNFSLSWADEISVGFANKPVSVYIAVRETEIIGFAAYECTRRAFFGPAGVLEAARGAGVGKALLIACMHSLREMGYVYGIIGHAGPVEFYQKTVGAIVIPGSDPGIYTNLL